MTTIVDGTTGVTFPAGGVGNPAGAVVGTTDTQTLTNKTLTAPTLASANITTALTLTGAAGTSGQALTSGGSGVAPTWTTIGASAATPTALGTVYGNTSSQNAAIGQNSLKTITGDYNTSVGRDAMLGATPFTANRNDAFGYGSMTSVTSGSYNSCFGFLSGANITTAQYNVAVGPSALQNNTASSNTAVGYQALTTCTTGTPNTAVGRALRILTTGGQNVAIGDLAGEVLTTGTFNTFIGNNIDASSSSVSNAIVINAAGTKTDKGASTGYINPNTGGVYQGNNSAAWSVSSDRRLKKNIVDNTEGLNIVSQIRVRNFEYRLPEEVTELDAHCAIEKTGVQLGVIAQELQEVCADCVKTESTGVMAVDSDNVFWHMVNAIKDLKAIVDAQAVEIADLKAKVA